MLPIHKIITRIIIPSLVMVCSLTSTQAQKVKQASPKFWFGISGGANLNFFEGTTQTLNATTKAPTAFHEGKGIGPYGSIFMEYRPGPVFGGMLNVAFDDRSGKFDGVMAPCNCPATLSTATRYIAIEPSLRIAPFGSGLYIFAGPRVSMNIGKSFTYNQKNQPEVKSDMSDVMGTVFSGQVGAGYDIRMSAKKSPVQFNISPFASFHPYFGQEPRKVESWSVTTIRFGVALKWGKNQKVAEKKTGDVNNVVNNASSTPLSGAALPVLENNVNASVITKLKSKYGPSLYDITLIKSPTEKDKSVYVIRTKVDGGLKTETVDEEGTILPNQ